MKTGFFFLFFFIINKWGFKKIFSERKLDKNFFRPLHLIRFRFLIQKWKKIFSFNLRFIYNKSKINVYTFSLKSAKYVFWCRIILILICDKKLTFKVEFYFSFLIIKKKKISNKLANEENKFQNAAATLKLHCATTVCKFSSIYNF